MLIDALVLLALASPFVSDDDSYQNASLAIQLTDAVMAEMPYTFVTATATAEMETEASDKGSATCVDYTIDGHYYKRNHEACQRKGFVRRPPTISACELEQLHHDCVNRINMYRTGALRFTNGMTDSLVVSGLAPVQERRGSNQCSSEAAMGDLIENYQGNGGCAGAHANAFVCGGGSVGQNSCCSRGAGAWGKYDTQKYDSYAKVRQEMFNCLQGMWDEGQNPGGGGHWRNMRNPVYAHVSCGFAWSEDGRVMMTQDFAGGAAQCAPSCGSCGGSDSCSHNKCVCQGTKADTTVSYEGGCGPKDSQASGLSAGAKIAIAVCVIAVFVVASIGVMWYFNRAAVDAKLRRMKLALTPGSANKSPVKKAVPSASPRPSNPRVVLFKTAPQPRTAEPSWSNRVVQAVTRPFSPQPKPKKSRMEAIKEKFGG